MNDKIIKVQHISGYDYAFLALTKNGKVLIGIGNNGEYTWKDITPKGYEDFNSEEEHYYD